MIKFIDEKEAIEKYCTTASVSMNSSILSFNILLRGLSYESFTYNYFR